MKKNSITILAIVTIAIVAAAVFATRDDTGTAEANGDDTLLPGLADRLNDVGALHLVQGEKEVTVELRDVGWGVAERSNYPAQFETIKALVLQLAELSVVEPKTSKPELYDKLGLGDPSEPEATSTLVEVRDREGGTLASVVFSKPTFKRQSQELFARHTGDPQSYLVTGTRLGLNADPLTWIDRELIRLDDDRVFRAEAVHADGEVLAVERSAKGNDQFAVQDLPEGKKESYPGIANSFATGLSYLRMSDVKPVGEVDFTAEPVAKTTFRTYDGLVIVIETARVDEAYWIRVVPSFDPPPIPEDADAAVAEDLRAMQEDAAKEVRKLERNLGRWAYQLPEAKALTLTKRAEDFLVDEDPPPAMLEAGDESTDDMGAPGQDAMDESGSDDEMDGSVDATGSDSEAGTEPPSEGGASTGG